MSMALRKERNGLIKAAVRGAMAAQEKAKAPRAEAAPAKTPMSVRKPGFAIFSPDAEETTPPAGATKKSASAMAPTMVLSPTTKLNAPSSAKRSRPRATRLLRSSFQRVSIATPAKGE